MTTEERDEIAIAWRDALLRTVEAKVPDGTPVLLSGGLDSVTLVTAMVRLGQRPTCYSFRLGEIDSLDVIASRAVAFDFGLPLVVETIPRDPEVLVDDVLRVLRLLGPGRFKKAMVQCALPVMRLADRVVADGFDRAVVGTGAICLDDRTVAVMVAQQGEEIARRYRADKMLDRYRECGTGMMHVAAANLGVRLVEPYSENPIRDLGLGLDYAELNRPRQKGIAIRAFPEIGRFWRRNSPLQVGSGIREYHDEVLLPSEWNTGGWKVVAPIYRRMSREVHREVV